jgi:hypothetical protein
MTQMDPAKRVRCPCCGYPTLGEPAAYEICELCWWEDDGQNDPHADEVWGGPNHGYSLAQARRNFQQFLVMYEPEHDRRIGGRDSEPQRAAKQALIEAFRHLDSAPASGRAEIEAAIRNLERELRLMLKRKIKEYEASAR